MFCNGESLVKLIKSEDLKNIKNIVCFDDFTPE